MCEAEWKGKLTKDGVWQKQSQEIARPWQASLYELLSSQSGGWNGSNMPCLLITIFIRGKMLKDL